MLISSGNAWSGPVLEGELATKSTGHVLLNTNRYNLLRKLPSLMNLEVFRNLLTTGWAISKDGFMSYHNTITLSTFSSDPASFNSLTTAKDIFVSAKLVLVDAIKNLEHYFVFAFGMTYNHMCKDIIESLQFGDWSDQKWDIGYTRYSIEMVLFITFNEIRDISKSVYIESKKTFDISTPNGIYQIFLSRFKVLKPSIERVTEFQRIFADVNFRSRLFGNSEIPTGGTTSYSPYTGTAGALQRSTKNTGGRTVTPTAAGTQWCVYDVYNQAGLVNPKTEIPFQCLHGSSCTFKHGDFKGLHRNEQQQLIAKWSAPNAKGFPRTPITIATALTAALDKQRSGTSSKKFSTKK